jgi:hypothetical protein
VIRRRLSEVDAAPGGLHAGCARRVGQVIEQLHEQTRLVLQWHDQQRLARARPLAQVLHLGRPASTVQQQDGQPVLAHERARGRLPRGHLLFRKAFGT